MIEVDIGVSVQASKLKIYAILGTATGRGSKRGGIGDTFGLVLVELEEVVAIVGILRYNTVVHEVISKG